MADQGQAGRANADQIDYWNTGPGAKWILFQERLDRLFSNVTERLLARAAPRPGERILDIGCGTGATSLALAEEVGPEGAVIGIDISGVLLERANARRSEAAFHQVSYLSADAQTHAFEADAFDLLISRFGVMFFDDPVAAFGNLAGALRPGGRLCFASWAPMSENPWFNVARDAAIRRLREPAPAPPTAPGPFAFADSDYVLGILTAAGYAGAAVEVEEVALFHPGTAEDAADLASNLGPSARIVKEFEGSAEDVASIARETAKGFGPYANADGVRVPACLNFFSAMKGDS